MIAHSLFTRQMLRKTNTQIFLVLTKFESA